MPETRAQDRLAERARAWGVTVGETAETNSSLIAYGRRGAEPVVLKIVKQPGDEWNCGEILAAFDGRGVVRVYEHEPGAALLERLDPGHAVVDLSLNGRDDEATEILADVIGSMSPGGTVPCPTVQDWGKSFDRYIATDDAQVPRDLVLEGHRVFADLCATQARVRLLHGDLQHYNVLFDRERGWLAIDPKGVLGEIEYEIGAALRNPFEQSGVFTSPAIVEKRVDYLASRLRLDATRALAWSFGQAVLSAIWEVEDGFAVDSNGPAIRLAESIRLLMANAGWSGEVDDGGAPDT